MADYAARRTAMVDTQVRPSDVTKFPIINAMLSVAKEDFVHSGQRETSYVGENIDLGQGRVILEPRTMAKMLDGLDIQPTETVLDVGCGLGYSSAIISKLADFVVALEDQETLANEAQDLLSQAGADNVAVQAGAMQDGAPKHGPYDVITIQGGVETIPEALLDQLRDGGRIAAIFVEQGLAVCRIGNKSKGTVTWRYAFNAGAPVVQGFEAAREFAL